MSESLAKSLKNELILRMQGSQKNPKLKHIRENLLEIKKASELAEILDITRQTMSKIEKCLVRLSGAQYLAICAIIDKKKNELLNELFDNERINKDILYKLQSIGEFYNIEFNATLFWLYLRREEVIKKAIISEIVSNLSMNTCFAKWMECINAEEVFSRESTKKMIENDDILIMKLSEKDLASLVNIFNLSSLNGEGKIIFEYNGMLDFFKRLAQNVTDINNHNDSDEDTYNDVKLLIDFIINFSLLKKGGKIKFVDFANMRMNGIDFSKPLIMLTQEEMNAYLIKAMSIYVDDTELVRKYGLGKGNTVFGRSNICKFEEGKFIKWKFDSKGIEECLDAYFDEMEKVDMTKEQEKYMLLLYNVDEKTKEMDYSGAKKVWEETLDEADDLLSANIMDKELEDVLEKIMSYIKPGGKL